MRTERLFHALASGVAFGFSFILGTLVWFVLPFVEVGEIGSFRYLGLTIGAAGVIAGIVLDFVSDSRERLRFTVAGVLSFGVSLGIVASGVVFVLFFFATFVGFVGIPPGVPSRLRLPLVIVLMAPLFWASAIGVITGTSIGGLLGLITRRVSVIRSAMVGFGGFGVGGVLGAIAAMGLKQLLAPGCRRLHDCPTVLRLLIIALGGVAFFCGGASLGRVYSRGALSAPDEPGKPKWQAGKTF